LLPNICKSGAKQETTGNHLGIDDQASRKNAQLPDGQASEQVASDSAQRVLERASCDGSLMRLAVCGGGVTTAPAASIK
jgi:hypothetical protein